MILVWLWVGIPISSWWYLVICSSSLKRWHVAHLYLLLWLIHRTQSWSLQHSSFLAWRSLSFIQRSLSLFCHWIYSWFPGQNLSNFGYQFLHLAHWASSMHKFPLHLLWGKLRLLWSYCPFLLRNNLIPLHQFSNFIQSLSNHPGSSTMLLGISADSFTVGAVAGAVNISVSVHLFSLEAFSVILKDPSCSDNALILFVLLKLILVHLCSLHYMCFIPNR